MTFFHTSNVAQGLTLGYLDLTWLLFLASLSGTHCCQNENKCQEGSCEQPTLLLLLWHSEEQQDRVKRGLVRLQKVGPHLNWGKLLGEALLQDLKTQASKTQLAIDKINNYCPFKENTKILNFYFPSLVPNP